MSPVWNPKLAAILGASGVLVSAVLWIAFHKRITPAEREKRRRLAVNAFRRATEGVVNESDGDFIHYQYELRGVSYSASQDVTALAAMLPDNRGILLGAASVRFDPRNPANSIIICEEWSGMRAGAPREVTAGECEFN